jgi:hypothetical protein
VSIGISFTKELLDNYGQESLRIAAFAMTSARMLPLGELQSLPF